MIVLCDGMPRSGSTWAFNVARQLLRLNLPSETIYAGFQERPGVALNELSRAYRHLVIKTHLLDDTTRELCRSGQIRSIYTHRQPEDAIASFMRMFDAPFEKALTSIESSLSIFEFHLNTQSACIIPYEQILLDSHAIVERAAVCLGLPCKPQAIDLIVRENSLERAKAIADGIRETHPDTVLYGDHVFDRNTLLHRNHITDGRIGYGLQRLSREQVDIVEARIGQRHNRVLSLSSSDCRGRKARRPATLS